MNSMKNKKDETSNNKARKTADNLDIGQTTITGIVTDAGVQVYKLSRERAISRVRAAVSWYQEETSKPVLWKDFVVLAGAIALMLASLIVAMSIYIFIGGSK